MATSVSRRTCSLLHEATQENGIQVRVLNAVKERVFQICFYPCHYFSGIGAFNRHGGIWLLELNKFYVNRIESEDQRWLKFFKDGEQLNDSALPDWMNTQIMR